MIIEDKNIENYAILIIETHKKTFENAVIGYVEDLEEAIKIVTEANKIEDSKYIFNFYYLPVTGKIKKELYVTYLGIDGNLKPLHGFDNNEEATALSQTLYRDYGSIKHVHIIHPITQRSLKLYCVDDR